MLVNAVEYDIGANNILFGHTRFLTLTVPPGWRISRSYLQPDIYSNVRQGPALWVEAGQTDQIVFNPLKRVALDLTITVKRGKSEKKAVKAVHIHSEGSMLIHGHDASYFWGEVGIGWRKKKKMKILSVVFHCSELARTITITFTGRCREIDLMDILEALKALKCH